uniref:ADP-ribosyl cyclase/cyclic ADP-ribose hydrolase n=1 Tax=Salix viminalis TaxID=40686 RepID=A0A6N2LGA3_SALVM
MQEIKVLPSLSGLCSLEELDLCACNLGEGAVPEDIGFLSSLRSLNLSKNNFVSLPKSINHLSRLEKLALKDCVMLESLPEVPLNVQKVKLDGGDTRKNFTGHLYSNLVQGGINVYMDDRELERGKTIKPALWQAIEESRFSRNYASSPWCLDKLVKIVQCMKEMGHTALPVFYDVDPSEVANQTGDYKKAFIEHQEVFSENPDMVQSWSDCLSTVANLSGWDVRNREESQ